MQISRYQPRSIDWLPRIITRIFTAAIKLRNRNDPLVSDAIRVSDAFGQRLAQLRTDKGLSQERVADLAAIHRTAISNLEKGSNLPRLDTLLKLAAALEVEPCHLIQGLPKWTPPSSSPGRFGASGET
jgi:DNA-binding XRE family transcriptional regulator